MTAVVRLLWFVVGFWIGSYLTLILGLWLANLLFGWHT